MANSQWKLFCRIAQGDKEANEKFISDDKVTAHYDKRELMLFMNQNPGKAWDNLADLVRAVNEFKKAPLPKRTPK